jgi:hypothetical protein
VPGSFTADWVKHSYELVGTGGPVDLTFLGAHVNGWIIDDVSLTPISIVTPGTETTSGTITFTDADTADTHTVLSVTPLGMNHVGTFNATLDPADDSTGGQPGTVRWTFNVSDAALAFLTAQQSVDQLYRVDDRRRPWRAGEPRRHRDAHQPGPCARGHRLDQRQRGARRPGRSRVGESRGQSRLREQLRPVVLSPRRPAQQRSHART